MGIMYDAASLRSLLNDAVRRMVSDKDIAVAFSGGIDSGIIAAIAKQYASSTTLYTVGMENSHDMIAAEEAGKQIGSEITRIFLTTENVIHSLEEMIKITETIDPVTLSFEIPLFLVCENCKESVIIGGQGADELFGGYSKYVGLNEDEFISTNAEDIRKLRDITLIHEKAVSEHFKKEIRYPFLDDDLINAVKQIGVEHLLSTDDPQSRKRVLRDVALNAGYGWMATRPKKAAQYGSGAMAVIRGICKERGMTFSELIDELGGDVNDR